MVRRIEIGFAAALLGWLLLAGRAEAGTYTVVQCGWGVGAEAAWVGNSTHFRAANECGSSTPGARSITVANGKRTDQGAYARWRWTAPPGAQITGVRGYWRRSLGDGFRQRIASIDQAGGRHVLLSGDNTDTGASPFSATVSGGGRAVESQLECRRSDRCEQSPLAWASAGRLILTLRDAEAPALTMTGALAGGGWLRGPKAFDFDARDDGAGVAALETVVDGDLRRREDGQCRTVSVEGVDRGAAVQPCQPSRSGSQALNTAAFSDGPHSVDLCALDFAGNRGCGETLQVRFDNTAPASPRALVLAGGDGWRAINGYSVGWRDPAQGPGSPVVAAWYRLRAADASFDSGPVRVEEAAGALEGIDVPAPGAYELSTWLEDEAGNADESTAETLMARFDDIPPEVAFEETADPSRPEEVAAIAADAHSGIAAGRLLYRRLGTEEWTEMPTETVEQPAGGSRLVARFPSDSVEHGTYELRAETTDAAGNTASTSERADGSPMLVETPLKPEAVLHAGLVHGHDEGAAIVVPYGERASVEGTLRTTAGEPLADAPIELAIDPAAGSLASPSTLTERTDGGGRFRVILPAGPSRRIVVSYPGSDDLAATAAPALRLLSRGQVTLSGSPRALRNRQRVTLRGAAGKLGAHIPGGGKLVELQFLDRRRGRWQGVGVVRTAAGGAFVFRHRFLRIRRPARVTFRAAVPEESGWPYEEGVSRPVTVSVRP